MSPRHLSVKILFSLSIKHHPSSTKKAILTKASSIQHRQPSPNRPFS
jgi:hypothetical protein